MATRITPSIIEEFSHTKNNIELLDKYGLLYIDLDLSELDKQLYYRRLFSEKFTFSSSIISRNERNHNLSHFFEDQKLLEKWSLFKKIREVVESLNFRVVLEKAHANLHNFSSESSHHVDFTSPSTVYYANPEWNPEWGGETWLMDDNHEVIDSVRFSPARLVIFNGNRPHYARPCTHYAKGLNRLVLASRFKFIDEQGNEQYQYPEKEFKFVN